MPSTFKILSHFRVSEQFQNSDSFRNKNCLCLIEDDKQQGHTLIPESILSPRVVKGPHSTMMGPKGIECHQDHLQEEKEDFQNNSSCCIKMVKTLK